MVMLLDINTISKVFNAGDSDHLEFKPVKEWLLNNGGCILYGGSKYISELAQLKSYLGLFAELRKANKILFIDSNKVDSMEISVSSQAGVACDDPHIIAILGVSGCELVCSVDVRSYSFIRKTKSYCGTKNKVKIYSRFQNRHLLPNKSAVDKMKLQKIRNYR